MKSKRVGNVTSELIAGVTTPAVSANSIELTVVEIPHSIKMLSIDCLPEISQYFYMGDKLSHIETDTGPAVVLPSLKVQIESLLGAGNYEYAYHHIGPYQVSLTWLIKSAGADETVSLITAWLRYAELDDIITVETIALTDREYQLLTGA